jgi:asparagine synthase (glutamine-hydrolysing)
MCGICGVMDNGNACLSDTLEMLSKIRHRGPDSVGAYMDGNIWTGKCLDDFKGINQKGNISLGQSRLEIVGGKEGIQPISSSRLAIVHNGEIYNYRELKPLVRNGSIKGDNDSEVLVNFIEEFYDGDLLDAVKKAVPFLDGMYAFAVTDGQSLVLARDPIGKKPLYFTDEFPFRFASERKAIFNGNGNIKRLVPGAVLEVRENKIKIENGREIEKPPIDITDMEEALDMYEGVFDKAIEKRVAGLDKVGVLFSGGIDSVLVARALQLKGCSTTCYSVGTENSSDMKMAKKVARELELDLKVNYLTEESTKHLLTEIIESIELNGLLQVEVAIPMYIAARSCSDDGHKVMFSGQAADELFAGYSWYKDIVKENGHLTLHHKLWEDIEYLYLDTLEREDRMAMAHAIEIRAPFLDRELIRTVMRFAPHLKIKDGEDAHRKLVHRKLAQRKGIPAEIAFREKSPAQDGTGVHNVIKALAYKHFKNRNFEEADLLDYGSNYRYLDEDYGTPEMIAFLSEITSKNNVEFLATDNEDSQFVEASKI